MQDKLHFKISAALKDIIGRDLITDDFVAIFELVKNSYDAYASSVDIYFENLNTENSKIIIKDNGKGMDYDDLINKWLFVAYSAKREGTEDITFDYRDKISVQRAFAGAKGIGRFSCDRLGRLLYMETTKFQDNPTTQVLITEWEKFEKDRQAEFIDISVLHETRPKSGFDIEHGTVLEISDLRSDWDRAKLLKLKESLSKLINPNSQKEKEFSIHIYVPEMLASDDLFIESHEKVNGEVENFIFEMLDLKTTKITSTVSSDNKYIETELIDGGTLIYKIKEKNKFSLLYGINYTLYYLNRSAKITFTKKMGLTVKDYGNIFLYKNGFRIYPFGEPGEDPLKVNVRKTQGYNRFLGLRELIGQIEINNDENELKETSSRGDGLIKTKTYYQLEECFWETLKRLERYVIDVQRWGLSIEENENLINKDQITQLIGTLTGSEDLIDIQYPDNFFNILEASQSSSAEKVIKNLNKLAFESGNENLIIESKKATQKFHDILQAKKQAEFEAKEQREKVKVVSQELDFIIKENLLLKNATNEETVEFLSIEHHINQSTRRVDKYLQNLIDGLRNHDDISSMILIANNISLENRKISSLINFVRKANFDTMSADFTGDLIDYITEYIENIYKEDRIRIINNSLIDVNLDYNPDDKLMGTFVPLEINIILDNLLDNSFKANAKEANISLKLIGKNTLLMNYTDNGVGIKEQFKNKIFDFGFTTTGGSGIGLFHIKKLIKESFNGDITLVEKTNGIEFNLTFQIK